MKMTLLARVICHRHLRPFRRFCSLPNPNPNPNPSPSIPSMRSNLKALLKEQDPDKLTAGCKLASSSDRFRRKGHVFEVVVLRLAAAGRHDAVEDLLEHLKTYTADFAGEGSAARLIYLYSRAGMFDQAAATFHQIPSLGCPRTVFSFNSLLSACARAKDTDQIARLLAEIPASDPSIVPNTMSYNILVTALRKKGDLDAALNTLHLMEKNNISPDLVTYNTLLNGFYGSGRFDDGERVWMMMAEKNINLDVLSYNSKMRGLVLEGKLSEAVEIVNELSRVGLKPDTFTFNDLIDGYCLENKLEDAMKIYRELRNNDCVPNRFTYEKLIPKLCESGQFSSALKLCNESITRDCFVEPGVLQEVVDGLVRIGKLAAAKQILNHAKQRRHLKQKLNAPLPSFFTGLIV